MNSSPQTSHSNILRQWVTIAAILGAFLVNVLSNLFPFNGLNIGEISNTLFSGVQIIPANYAFAIWGVIYLGLIAFGIYQLLPAQRHDPTLRRIDYLLVIACVAQSVWVYLFLSRLFALSVLAMLGILLPLVGVYLRLGDSSRRSREEKWFVDIPLSIYLGWISVATVVNVAITLYSLGWTGWGIAPAGWTAIMLVVAAAIAAVIAVQRRDVAYPLVIIWALVAIAVRQASTALIVVTAVGLAVALLLLLLSTRLKARPEPG